MKLLRLRFKNLNSLYGEYAIDFEHPEYVTNGLFAITGPTGAGKTTLLDAISLALYAKTPRVKPTDDSCEFMSRDCSECFAEVTFESTHGRFRAFWSRHRARKKSDGELQNAKHTLTDAITNLEICGNKKNTLAKISEVVGLDYDQFMRSIMLAQGEFANFIKSPEDARASILSKITGTHVYSDIGAAVFERGKLEHQCLEDLKARSSTITLLDDATRSSIEQRIIEIDGQLAQTALIGKQLDESLHWLQQIEVSTTECERFEREYEESQTALHRSAPLRIQLERAERAQA